MKDFKLVRLNATLFPVIDFERDLWRAHGLNVAEVEANTPADIIPHVRDCDAVFVISAALPTAVVESMARCRVISRLGTGTDKIDVQTATRLGIVVSNVPTFCVPEQADHTMALLLDLARKLPQMARLLAAGRFLAARQLSISCRRLSTLTLGLVGFGHSAVEVARRARGFGMRVIATRGRVGVPSPEADALGVTMTDLDTVLRESDYVSLHLPLNAGTRHLLDDARLRLMKPGAYLINTSRGALVDEWALVAALREGRLAGAGLDTFEHIDIFAEHEAPPQHPLLELDNVILTPHIAAGSAESRQDQLRGGVENAAAILAGRWPPQEHIVNPTVAPRVALQRE
jgi:D-3-phosphoglycerate dehydrogenase / 2-oxoglutarate reductase